MLPKEIEVVGSDRWPVPELGKFAKGISVVMVKTPARGGAQAVRLSGGKLGFQSWSGWGTGSLWTFGTWVLGGGQVLVKVAEI